MLQYGFPKFIEQLGFGYMVSYAQTNTKKATNKATAILDSPKEVALDLGARSAEASGVVAGPSTAAKTASSPKIAE